MTSRAQCDDCQEIAPDDSRVAVRMHAESHGHTTRFVVQETSVYVPVVPPAADDQPTPESLLRKAMRSRRIELGWPQEEVADRLTKYGTPMHSTGITRIEMGKRGIGLNEVVAICAVLGMDAKEFLS
jgi:hypothetical protein